MSARGILVLLALMLGACGVHNPSPTAQEPGLTTEGWAWVPLHPRTHEPALAALILDEGMPLPGKRESEDHPLAVAVWADGTVISSASGGVEYGHPYRTANIGASACEDLRSRIRAIMLDREGKRVSFGVPDAGSEELLVREGERVWRMSSCIDLFEASGAVAFSGGIGARDQIPAVDPNDPKERELRAFREAWGQAKQLVLSAVPAARDNLEAEQLEFVAMGSRPR
jgi:hypothetical protein